MCLDQFPLFWWSGDQVRLSCLGCWHVRRPSGNEADKHQQRRADNRSGPKTRNLKPAETHCELSASKRFWSHCLRYQDVITDANKPAHTHNAPSHPRCKPC